MEMLNHIPQTNINWEPLHTTNGLVPKKLNWGGRPQLYSDSISKQEISLLKNIISGNIGNSWTRTYQTIPSTIKANRTITKFVRANLLAPVILEKFNFNFKPIVLVRHPIDICYSQIKAFGDINDKPSKFEPHNWKNNERFITHLDYLNSKETLIEHYVTYWCINNVTALNHKIVNEKCKFIYYDNLVLNPEKEIRSILSINNIKNIEEIIDSIEFRKASSTDFNSQLETNPKVQLSKNIDKISPEMKIKIQSIFDYFNFKLYRADSPYAKTLQ